MGLFDKKYCDACGEKIGLLGNRKLEDGNLCKECTKKLSPFFSERRHSTIAEIKDQLAYRAANKAAVAAFQATRTFGTSSKILFDENAKKFMVATSRKIEEENPDVLDFSQITGYNLDIRETREEVKMKDSNGRETSYFPPRYDYHYDFNFIINVNSPWFDEMSFRLNSLTIVVQSSGNFFGIASGEEIGNRSKQYRECSILAEEIKEYLSKVRQDTCGV
jgi:hypothetical protein